MILLFPALASLALQPATLLPQIPQRAVARMLNAWFRLIPESADTRGHGTHIWARFWKADLADLLARTKVGGAR